MSLKLLLFVHSEPGIDLVHTDFSCVGIFFMKPSFEFLSVLLEDLFDVSERHTVLEF